MAAHSDGSYTHAAGCGCAACACDQDNTDATGGTSGPASGVSVADYTALLYYQNSGLDHLRWNGQTDVGTAVVVTYNFVDTPDLPPVSDDPFGATSYWAYDSAQRALFEEVAGKYEAISGVIFVEIEGEAMINVYGSSGGNAGGWANVAFATDTSTGSGDFTNNYMNMDAGDYGYQVNLHELGHSLGLQHPFEGDFTLDPSVDNQTNTVMTYNIEQPYVTELGVFDIQAMQDIYGTADVVEDWRVSVKADGRVQIITTNGRDTVLAVGQNTEIKSGGSLDVVIGREGDDKIFAGWGPDKVSGGLGKDIIYGNRGNDWIAGDIGEDPFSGEQTGNDILSGGLGNDKLFGGHGNDRLFGNDDNDQLWGGYGVDRLLGGNGHDTLNGGDGKDFMTGGNGHDTLNGGDGKDFMTGGNGNDIFVFENADASEINYILDFTSGDDHIDMSDFGFINSVNNLNQSVSGGDMTLSYSNWLTIILEGQTYALTNDDFIFA